MKIKLVTGKNFYVNCVSCGEQKLAGDGQKVYANILGEPFKAYYCDECVCLFCQVIVEDNQNDHSQRFKAPDRPIDRPATESR